MPHALPHVVQDSIKILTLSPPPVVTPQYVPATNIDINVSSKFNNIQLYIICICIYNFTFLTY